MKDKNERLRKIVSLAAADERRESLALGRSQKRLDEARGRLAELERYRHEYARKSRPGDHTSAVRWTDYQTFLTRLDDAVKAQQQEILESEESVSAHRQRWMKQRRHLDSLTSVTERNEREARAEAARREQRVLDDRHGSRRHRDTD